MGLGFAPAYVLDELKPYEVAPALGVERYQHRALLSALQTVAWTNVAVWGANVSPHDLLPLPWTAPAVETDDTATPWSYEDTMAAGVGLLDYLNK